MTYSIVAFDPSSGVYGVAVQSHWFNVGRSTAWIRFGAGVVATQALTNQAFGPKGLDIMAAGVDAPTTLRVLLDADPDRERRQVAVLDHTGKVATHTGSGCVGSAHHIIGDTWSVQGNLLRSDDVIPAMADAFERASGTLAERMVAALAAAEDAGGDLRGRQSAGLRVAPGDVELLGGHEAGIDILIADHDDPVKELRRLVEVDRAYRALRRGGTALDAGDLAEARHQYAMAASLRHGPEVDFWRALGLGRMGSLDEAARILTEVFRQKATFREVLERLADSEPVHRTLLGRITGTGC